MLPIGDIASGASDGVVRVWTRSEERKANTEQVQELEKAVASRQLNKYIPAHRPAAGPSMLILVFAIGRRSETSSTLIFLVWRV